MIDMALLSSLRRWPFREGMPIREIARRTRLSRNTVRKYLARERCERLNVFVRDLLLTKKITN